MLTIQPLVPDEAPSRCSWKSIVDQVAAGSPLGLEILYRRLSPLRFEITGTAGWNHIDDLYHDTFVALVETIRKGLVRAPDALPELARTIHKRKRYRVTSEAILTPASLDPMAALARDCSLNPEQQRIRAQQREIADRMLRSLPARWREVLTRFYLKEESAADIQSSMQLTATQYRLMKSRAIAWLGERGRAHLARCKRSAGQRRGGAPTKN